MRLTTWIIGLPIAVAAIWIALANRHAVVFSLDPFSQENPALSVQLPLYLLLFAAVLLGVLLGGLAIGLRRVARRTSEIASAASDKAVTLLPTSLRKSKTQL